MIAIRFPATLLTGVVLALSASSPRTQELIAVSWAGNVTRVDPGAGTTIFDVPSGTLWLNAMTRTADGVLYATGGSSELFTIDPTTGAASFVVSLGGIDVRGLSTGPNGQLYAVLDAAFGSTDGLVRIDPATGAATSIGNTGLSCVQALAFDGTTLYAWCGRLFTLNQSNGLSTPIGNAANVLDVQAMYFDSEGALWGGRTSLARIDTSTGVQTIVSTGLFSDARGIELAAPDALVATPAALSVSSGGVQSFAIAPGLDYAGDFYLLLGSLTGTSPGLSVDGFVIPLGFDAYTSFTLLTPNTPPLASSFGALDAAGTAQATFTLPANAFPALVGFEVNHAYLVVRLQPTLLSLEFVSDAEPLELLP